MRQIVFICETCCTENGQVLGPDFAARLRAALPKDARADVRLTPCLNMCEEPLSVALTGEGRPTYLFSGLRPDEDLADMVALVGVHEAAGVGEITDARPAGRLRFCLKARMPAI